MLRDASQRERIEKVERDEWRCAAPQHEGRREIANGSNRPKHTLAQPAPSAEAMASSAACALEPSGPPACAISERQPPPFQPTPSLPLRTRSTSEKPAVSSSVPPTPTPALPARLTPTM